MSPLSLRLFVSAALLLSLAACGQKGPPANQAPPPPEVGVVTVKASSVPLTRELVGRLAATRTAVRSEMLGKVAAEFDAVHNIHRAVEVGSVDAVIEAHELRPRIIAAIEASG